jgi:hypothetical protein
MHRGREVTRGHVTSWRSSNIYQISTCFGYELFPARDALESSDEENGDLVLLEIVILMLFAVRNDLFISQLGEPIAIRLDIIIAMSDCESYEFKHSVVAIDETF